ncbi:unnamed protein product, partial [Amoebophrya sp. A25]|eukprot:GSA25T00010527001.1
MTQPWSPSSDDDATSSPTTGPSRQTTGRSQAGAGGPRTGQPRQDRAQAASSGGSEGEGDEGLSIMQGQQYPHPAGAIGGGRYFVDDEPSMSIGADIDALAISWPGTVPNPFFGSTPNHDLHAPGGALGALVNYREEDQDSINTAGVEQPLRAGGLIGVYGLGFSQDAMRSRRGNREQRSKSKEKSGHEDGGREGRKVSKEKLTKREVEVDELRKFMDSLKIIDVEREQGVLLQRRNLVLSPPDKEPRRKSKEKIPSKEHVVNAEAASSSSRIRGNFTDLGFASPEGRESRAEHIAPPRLLDFTEQRLQEPLDGSDMDRKPGESVTDTRPVDEDPHVEEEKRQNSQTSERFDNKEEGGVASAASKGSGRTTATGPTASSNIVATSSPMSVHIPRAHSTGIVHDLAKQETASPGKAILEELRKQRQKIIDSRKQNRKSHMISASLGPKLSLPKKNMRQNDPSAPPEPASSSGESASSKAKDSEFYKNGLSILNKMNAVVQKKHEAASNVAASGGPRSYLILPRDPVNYENLSAKAASSSHDMGQHAQGEGLDSVVLKDNYVEAPFLQNVKSGSQVAAIQAYQRKGLEDLAAVAAKGEVDMNLVRAKLLRISRPSSHSSNSSCSSSTEGLRRAGKAAAADPLAKEGVYSEFVQPSTSGQAGLRQLLPVPPGLQALPTSAAASTTEYDQHNVSTSSQRLLTAAGPGPVEAGDFGEMVFREIAKSRDAEIGKVRRKKQAWRMNDYSWLHPLGV